MSREKRESFHVYWVRFCFFLYRSSCKTRSKRQLKWKETYSFLCQREECFDRFSFPFFLLFYAAGQLKMLHAEDDWQTRLAISVNVILPSYNDSCV